MPLILVFEIWMLLILHISKHGHCTYNKYNIQVQLRLYMPVYKETFHYPEPSWAMRCQWMRGVYPSPFLYHTTYTCPEHFLLRRDRGVLYIQKDKKNKIKKNKNKYNVQRISQDDPINRKIVQKRAGEARTFSTPNRQWRRLRQR